MLRVWTCRRCKDTLIRPRLRPWSGGGNDSPPHSPSPLHVQAQLDPPPQKQFPIKQKERTARERWFTAEPAYILPAVAPERTVGIPNAKAALSLAGLVLRNHVGDPIVLDRVGTPDPEVVKFNSKLRPGQRINQAVAVPEGTTRKPAVTKAVPVE